MRRLGIVLVLCSLWFASSSSSAVQQKYFGVMDDGPNQGLVAQTGFNIVKHTVWITPGNWHWNDLDSSYRTAIDQDMAAAQANGLSVILELYPVIKYGPPLGGAQQRGTCDLAVDLVTRFPQVFGVEVGVEPNNYTFWRPQFINGVQVSAAKYEKWLATCYHRLKAVKPDLIVVGGSLASSGDDNPDKEKSGTSPTLFLQKMCEAYKASDNTQPIMDWLDVHSYQYQSPDTQHPDSTTITIGDYDKLESLLSCFSGTAQPRPPIWWGESGYDTLIPPDLQKKLYIGEQTNPAPVDEMTQGRYYADSIRMAFCQPNSLGFASFLMVDEADLGGWQSGLAYAQGAQKRNTSGAAIKYKLKASWDIVRNALNAVHSGSVACG